MNRNRLLLLEDDPVSLAFLRDALAPMGADVHVAVTCADAEILAESGDALWLFDVNLPDGKATDLLVRLRVRGLDTAAVALTAEDDPAVHARLLAAGFARVACKPMPAPELRSVVLESLPAPPGPWDDARALTALHGRIESLPGLRALFLKDLPRQLDGVRDAAARGDADAARAELHRLRAGCGFVGACALQEAASTLQAQPLSPPALQVFLERGAALLADR